MVALGLTPTWWLPTLLERAAPGIGRRFLGLEIEIGSVESADFDHLALRGLKLRALDPDFPLQSASAAELEVDFSLRKLLRDPLLGLRAVRGDKIALLLDLRAPDDEEPGRPLALPDELPRIDLRELALTIELPDARLSAQAGALQCTDGEELTASTGPFEWRSGDREFNFSALALQAKYAQRKVRELALQAEGETRLNQVSIDLHRVSEEGALDAEGELVTPGGTTRFVLALAEGIADVQLDSHGFELRELQPFLPIEFHDLEGHVELAAKARFSPDEPAEGNATLKLTASRLGLAGHSLAHVELAASLEGGALRIDSLDAGDGANSARLHGVALALADFSAKTWAKGLSGALELEIKDAAKLGFRLPMEIERGLRDARLSVAAQFEDGRVDFQRFDLGAPGLRTVLAQGRLELDPPTNPILNLELDLEIEDLAGALSPFGIEECAGTLSAQLSAHGPLLDLDGRAVAEGSGLAVKGVEIGDFAFDARLSGNELRISRLVAASTLAELDGSGVLNVLDGSITNCTVRAHVPSIAALLPEAGVAGAAFAEFTVGGTLDSPTARMELDASSVRYAELPAGDVDLTARYDGGQLMIDALRVAAEGHELFASAALRIDLELKPFEVGLEALEHRHEGQPTLSLTEPVLLALESGGIRFADLQLSGTHGQVALNVAHGDAGTNVELLGKDLRLMPVLALVLPEGFELGRLDLDLRLSGTHGDLSLNGLAQAFEVRAPGVKPLMSIDLSLAEDDEARLLLEADAYLGEAGHVGLVARLPIDAQREDYLGEGLIELDLDLEIDRLEELLSTTKAGVQFSGALRASTQLRGDPAQLGGELWIAARELRFESPEIGASPPPLRLDARCVFADSIFVEELRLDAGEGLVGLSAEGEIGAPLDLRALIENADAWMCAAELDMSAWSSISDLAALAEIEGAFEGKEVPLRGGRLFANLALEGTLSEPLPRGSLSVREGVVRLGSGIPTADRVELELEGTPERITIGAFNGELGGATFHGSGYVALDGDEPRIDFEVRGKELLLARSRDLRVRANTDLLITGPISALTIAGLIQLTDTHYTKNFDIDLTRSEGPTSGAGGLRLFRLRESPLSAAKFEIDIHTLNPILVRNSTLAGALRTDLVLRGSGELPFLTGSVLLDSTFVRLPGSVVQIESGTILFRESNPFVPYLALNGEARTRGYDVQVVVSGDLDDPEITLSSHPPLRSDELLVLLATGQLPPDSPGSSNTAGALATYLAEDFIVRTFGSTPGGGEPLVSRFDIITGEDITRSGAETIWVSFRLTDRDQKGQSRYFLVGERDIYDFYNYGLRVTFRFP